MGRPTERMMMSILRATIETFRKGRDLDGIEAEALLDALINESDENAMAELFRSWNKKGIAEDEIYWIAKIMRGRCTKVNSTHERFVDIVGTGGSRTKTFNVSTAAAFVVAGEGLPVAKHGNKAATSNSGSADVLSELGIEPAVDAATAERCLNEIGVCFMFAPNFHRLSPTLGKVRRGLGFPTIFNCVGPLCNPASAPHQLIGVWDKELLPKMANALARLGTKKSWIVHGEDGLDEITIGGPTFVAEVEGDAVRTFEISPGDFDLKVSSLEEIKAGSSPESADLIRKVLANELRGSPAESIILINAMAALHLAGNTEDIGDGFGLAVESIEKGLAAKKLNQLAEAVNR